MKRRRFCLSSSMRVGHVHLGELLGVEPGQFAPGLVQGVELLLLYDLRRDVANQDDQPRIAGRGPRPGGCRPRGKAGPDGPDSGAGRQWDAPPGGGQRVGEPRGRTACPIRFRLLRHRRSAALQRPRSARRGREQRLADRIASWRTSERPDWPRARCRTGRGPPAPCRCE